MDTRKTLKMRSCFFGGGAATLSRGDTSRKIYVRCEKITGNVVKLYFILRMGRGRVPWCCRRKWAPFYQTRLIDGSGV
jgi:hypothetical protein